MVNIDYSPTFNLPVVIKTSVLRSFSKNIDRLNSADMNESLRSYEKTYSVDRQNSIALIQKVQTTTSAQKQQKRKKQKLANVSKNFDFYCIVTVFWHYQCIYSFVHLSARFVHSFISSFIYSFIHSVVLLIHLFYWLGIRQRFDHHSEFYYETLIWSTKAKKKKTSNDKKFTVFLFDLLKYERLEKRKIAVKKKK